MTAASALALGACNLGRQNEARVTVGLPLLDCGTLQANAGRRIETTFVAVAGAEFPPITEFRNQTPCSGESPMLDESNLATFDVDIPAGDNRALAIAVLGAPILLGTATVPDLSIRGVPLRTTTPRPVFFGGGMILKRAMLEGAAPRVNLILEPFVNVLGRVSAAGQPAAARLTFYAPDVSDTGCLSTYEDAETTTLSKLYQVQVGSAGAYLASVPYRATLVETDFGIVCNNDEAHGNELFGFAEGADGRLALFVPGRAVAPGRGLEPGMLLRNSVIFLRDPNEVGELLTSATLVTTRAGLELYLAGYSDALPAEEAVTLAVRPVGESAPQYLAFVAKRAATLGEGPGASGRKLASYDFLHRFGTRQPRVQRLLATQGLPAGEYVMTLPGGQFELPLRLE